MEPEGARGETHQHYYDGGGALRRYESAELRHLWRGHAALHAIQKTSGRVLQRWKFGTLRRCVPEPKQEEMQGMTSSLPCRRSSVHAKVCHLRGSYLTAVHKCKQRFQLPYIVRQRRRRRGRAKKSNAVQEVRADNCCAACQHRLHLFILGATHMFWIEPHVPMDQPPFVAPMQKFCNFCTQTFRVFKVQILLFYQFVHFQLFGRVLESQVKGTC